jgi:hypothetical protein
MAQLNHRKQGASAKFAGTANLRQTPEKSSNGKGEILADTARNTFVRVFFDALGNYGTIVNVGQGKQMPHAALIGVSPPGFTRVRDCEC